MFLTPVSQSKISRHGAILCIHFRVIVLISFEESDESAEIDGEGADFSHIVCMV